MKSTIRGWSAAVFCIEELQPTGKVSVRHREPDKPGFELELCCFLALRPWANDFPPAFFCGGGGAELCLHCCTQTSCGELGLLSVALWGLLIVAASLVAELGLKRLSCSAACGIFPNQVQTRVPYVGRQLLNHWTYREVPSLSLDVLICKMDVTPPFQCYYEDQA